MAKHIIDTESPEFDGIPMRLRESCKGQVLLGEDRRENGSLRGLITIDPESLAEIITDDTGGVGFPLTVNDPDELEAKANTVRRARRFAGMPAEHYGKTYEEYLADDTDSDNNSGHRKYAKIHEELMDDDSVKSLLQAKGVTLDTITAIKAKFKNAQSKAIPEET